MLTEIVTALDPGWGELVDIDLSDAGEWVGVFRDGQRFVVRTADDHVDAPGSLRFPIVRWLEPGRYVLVDARAGSGEVNAWILRPGRSDTTSFQAGDGIRDVLASRDRIVATYFDEGVFGEIPPGPEGIAVFDDRGRVCAGYQSTMGARAVDISDCYAAAWADASRIALLPYTSFPFVTWDVKTFEQTVVPTDAAVHGSSALTVSPEGVLFFGPCDGKTSIVSWARGRAASVVGRHTGPLRGLRGGGFLTHGANGFGVVNWEPAQQPEAADGFAPGR